MRSYAAVAALAAVAIGASASAVDPQQSTPQAGDRPVTVPVVADLALPGDEVGN